MTGPRPNAGAVSRLAAYLVDVVAIVVLYAAGAVAIAFVTRVVTGHRLDLHGDRDLARAGLAIWWFAYLSVSWATVGATLGMALVGLRVVRPDRSAVSPLRAGLRALAFSLSVALFGLGFLGIVFDGRRRGLHDLVAGTEVVYVGASG